MKRLLWVVLIVVFLSGCSEISQSLEQPVDPNDTTTVTIEVTPGQTFNAVAKELSDKKLISSAGALRNYVEQHELGSQLQVGTYQISPSMDIATIADILTEAPIVAETVTITIPEGFENVDVIARLQEYGFAQDVEAFNDILENHPFEYDFLEGIDRSYKLEGYLFPDTYEFFADASDLDVITKMLDNFDLKYTPEMRLRADELGMSTNDVVTLASIVEREARKREEFPIVAGVFQNRIAIDMPLQACSTVQYILGERKWVLSIEETQIESPYNTYQIPGLPPSPIAQPSQMAIEAVLYPAQTDYLFLVVANLGDGSHLFATTYEEHLANIAISEENLQKAIDEANE